MNKRPSSNVTLKFCPDHYNVYFKEVIPAMPLKYRIMTKIALTRCSSYPANSIHDVREVFLL